MLDSKARDALAGFSRWTGRVVSRVGLTPNMVTLAGVGITGYAAWLLLRDNDPLAGWVLAVAGCFDFIDGAVARATGRVTRFGAFLDSVTDRVSDGVILGTLIWVELGEGHELTAALAIAALVVVNLVSYVKAKAESMGYECKVGLMERAERIFVLVFGLVLHALTIALWVLLLGSALTLAQRLIRVARQAPHAQDTV